VSSQRYQQGSDRYRGPLIGAPLRGLRQTVTSLSLQKQCRDVSQALSKQQALNTALHNKILQLSLMPTMLARLVEKAREFDKNWCTFAGPTRGFKCPGHNPCIQEISEEESKINTTQIPHCSLFGQECRHRQG